MGMWDWIEEQYPASSMLPYYTGSVRLPQKGDLGLQPWSPNPAFAPTNPNPFPPPSPSGSSRLFMPIVSDSEPDRIDPSREAELARMKAARRTADTVRPFGAVVKVD